MLEMFSLTHTVILAKHCPFKSETLEQIKIQFEQICMFFLNNKGKLHFYGTLHCSPTVTPLFLATA